MVRTGKKPADAPVCRCTYNWFILGGIATYSLRVLSSNLLSATVAKFAVLLGRQMNCNGRCSLFEATRSILFGSAESQNKKIKLLKQ